MSGMGRRKVTIVDYGVGNLLSVSRAVEKVGATVEVAGDPARVAAADMLILPGVGAFGNGIQQLRARGLVEAIHAFAETERPFLGICLGMQLMFERSLEFGSHTGLGLLKGVVSPIPSSDVDGEPHKTPHVAWSALKADKNWAGTPLRETPEGAAAYFVHSFAVQPSDSSDRLAVCTYGGHSLTAAVARGALTGCQYHPEKSGPVGLGQIAAFVAT